ncbi:STAS domain-containing protein [Actinoplanes sp. NPDC024001]|uniref:STAS domain-containing protein n=1 Tax=Actinoplanes sp. NPDC024001 TaxID=3154598 RepID=UPI0033F40451
MTVASMPHPPLRVQPTRIGDSAVGVALAGDLDMDTGDVFRTRVFDILNGQLPAAIVLDLRELNFLGVAGVRSLCEAHTIAATYGCALTIGHAPEGVRWLLSMLELDRVFAMP